MWSPECRDNAGFERPYCSAIFRYGTRWRSSTLIAWCSSCSQTLHLRPTRTLRTPALEVLNDRALVLPHGTPLGAIQETHRHVIDHDPRTLFVDDLAGLDVRHAERLDPEDNAVLSPVINGL